MALCTEASLHVARLCVLVTDPSSVSAVGHAAWRQRQHERVQTLDDLGVARRSQTEVYGVHVAKRSQTEGYGVHVARRRTENTDVEFSQYKRSSITI